MKYTDILEAYLVCRGNKKGAVSTIKFEIDHEPLLLQLWRDINDRVYKPSRSIAFLVYKPRLREIFAADFRDRVVHHYIDIRLRPLLEKDLIETTCNNRVGKGVEAAVQYLNQAILEVSEGYTKPCSVCKMDMKGFFMSINKPFIKNLAIDYIREKYTGDDIEVLVYLIDITLSNCPEKNCVLKTPRIEWRGLDRSKSKFFIGADYGLTIGDLISQVIVNLLLDAFDHYVTGTLGLKYFVRYVDDFAVVGKKEEILKAAPLIREKLKEVGVTLHPKKFYIQDYRKGVEFVGSVIKPGRIYVHNRTVNNAFLAVERFNRITPTIDTLEYFRATINSYLGFMKNRATFNIRKRLVESISEKWKECITIPEDYSKVVIKKKYIKHNVIKKQLKIQRLCYKKELMKATG